MRINRENICIRKTKLAPTKTAFIVFQDIPLTHILFIVCIKISYLRKKNFILFFGEQGKCRASILAYIKYFPLFYVLLP
jgi:hypothetical protein